jgi:RNA polymerase sigma-70 factor (ECF subfamily)
MIGGPVMQQQHPILAQIAFLQGCAYKIAGGQDRDDLVQDTVYKALRSWKSYIEQGTIRAWLLKIMRNEYFTKQRHLGRLEYWGDMELEVLIDGSQEATVMLKETLKHSDVALPVEMAINDDYAEAAKRHHVPIGTIKSRLCRKRARLRKDLL